MVKRVNIVIMKKTVLRNIVLAIAVISAWCAGAMAAYSVLHHDGFMTAVSMLYVAGAICAAFAAKECK